MSTELQLQDALTLAVPVAMSSGTLAVAHWFPWRGGVGRLPRTTAYAIGTAIVVGLPVLTMLVTAALGVTYGQLFWALLLVLNVLASGVTVHLAYWIDAQRAVTLDEVSDAKTRE